MQLLTSRFIKDLLWILFFILFFYAITNNPITHPIPKPKAGNWSIQFMQNPIALGLAGHNYLVLRNANGKVETELHGLATDVQTRTWKYIGTNKTDILQVWEFSGTTSYLAGKSSPGIILVEGKEEDIKAIWGKGEDCAPTINQKEIPYPPFGVNMRGDTENSNSVAYTLSLCMGLDTKHIGLITPGENKNLLK